MDLILAEFPLKLEDVRLLLVDVVLRRLEVQLLFIQVTVEVLVLQGFDLLGVLVVLG